MAYKKPKIIATSEPKQTYVAGCGAYSYRYPECTYQNMECMKGPLN